MNKNTITLAKFLSRYLGIMGEVTKYLTHDDIKYMFPSVKRCSFEYIENHRGVVENGSVLLVTDGKRTIPYFASSITERNEVVVNKEEHKQKRKVTNYTDMNNYELRQLLNIRLNGYNTSRTARRELEDRGVILRKKYKREEFKQWRKDYERD